MTAHQLFQPFRLKSLKLKNRIVMAPMTRSFSPGGIPTPQVAEYYARRAKELGIKGDDRQWLHGQCAGEIIDLDHQTIGLVRQ